MYLLVGRALLFGKTRLDEDRFPDRGQIQIKAENRNRRASGPVQSIPSVTHMYTLQKYFNIQGNILTCAFNISILHVIYMYG